MEKKTTVILSGYPGKMCRLLAAAIKESQQFQLAEFAFTGPEVEETSVDGILLVKPAERERYLPMIRQLQEKEVVIVAEFSQFHAINDNVKFFCENNLSFVAGTTGGDLELIKKTIEASQVTAVVSANMSPEIVMFKAMFDFAAENFPGCMEGCEVEIVESHQSTKKDVSGTAMAFLPDFNQLGMKCDISNIHKVRDKETQKNMGIKQEHLGGHGWHKYWFRRPDGSMDLGFWHNINGRNTYVIGAMISLAFVARNKYFPAARGMMYSTVDVLQAG